MNPKSFTQWLKVARAVFRPRFQRDNQPAPHRCGHHPRRCPRRISPAARGKHAAPDPPQTRRCISIADVHASKNSVKKPEKPKGYAVSPPDFRSVDSQEAVRNILDLAERLLGTSDLEQILPVDEKITVLRIGRLIAHRKLVVEGGPRGCRVERGTQRV